MRAVVFGYHTVGVRCLKVLLARGIDVSLVVTHSDNPAEAIWFESMADAATEAGITVRVLDDGVDEALFEQVAALQPDFIFSFYFRSMLPARLLALARLGAYNMHGSLLPKYRGRVPINWAILHGETETGATLHEMAEKPDAGAIVAQTAVPILPDDTALEVFQKVTVAAEQTLWAAVPGLVDGTATRRPNVLDQGSYFGGRRPADGRIDWRQPAKRVYDLIRAVAPPYPGAFFELAGNTYIVAEARLLPSGSDSFSADRFECGVRVRDNRILGVCADGGIVFVKRLLQQGRDVSASELNAILGTTTI